MRFCLSPFPKLIATLLCSTLLGVVVADERATLISPDMLADIRAASESLTLGNSALRMEADVWRNFMPTAGAKAGSRPMVAILKIIVASGPAVSHRVTGVWILQDDIWQSHDIELPSNTTASPYEVLVHDGPQLQPYTYIDIVVRISDAKSGVHFLSARHQIIKAVE
jgi:hypothetical protein